MGGRLACSGWKVSAAGFQSSPSSSFTLFERVYLRVLLLCVCCYVRKWAGRNAPSNRIKKTHVLPQYSGPQ